MGRMGSHLQTYPWGLFRTPTQPRNTEQTPTRMGYPTYPSHPTHPNQIRTEVGVV